MKFFMASLISVLLAAQCAPARSLQSRRTGDQSVITAEEYAIYAAAINNEYASISEDKTLVIVDWTSSDVSDPFDWGRDKERLKKEFSSISQEIIDDYEKINAKSYQLKDSLNLKLKYALTPREKIREIFKRDPGGSEFHKQFPNSPGTTHVSRVGFNSTGDQALVYVSHICGPLCASWSFVLLVKKDKEWVVQKQFVARVS
jgi:hypothetical protein